MFLLQKFLILPRRIITVRIGIFVRVETALHIHMSPFSFLALARMIVFCRAHLAPVLCFINIRHRNMYRRWPLHGDVLGNRRRNAFWLLLNLLLLAYNRNAVICRARSGHRRGRCGLLFLLFLSTALFKRVVKAQEVFLAFAAFFAALSWGGGIGAFLPGDEGRCLRKKRLCKKSAANKQKECRSMYRDNGCRRPHMCIRKTVRLSMQTPPKALCSINAYFFQAAAG